MESKIDKRIRRFYSRKNQGSISEEKSFIQKIKDEYVIVLAKGKILQKEVFLHAR